MYLHCDQDKINESFIKIVGDSKIFFIIRMYCENYVYEKDRMRYAWVSFYENSFDSDQTSEDPLMNYSSFSPNNLSLIIDGKLWEQEVEYFLVNRILSDNYRVPDYFFLTYRMLLLAHK